MNQLMVFNFGGRNRRKRVKYSKTNHARGSKRSHQSALEMCNLSWTSHSSLEKDNFLNHSYVSPNMGCLECRQTVINLQLCRLLTAYDFRFVISFYVAMILQQNMFMRTAKYRSVHNYSSGPYSVRFTFYS